VLLSALYLASVLQVLVVVLAKNLEKIASGPNPLSGINNYDLTVNAVVTRLTQ
jgi:hypothetical protein